MLYPQSQEPLQEKDFLNPSSEYRAAPFWAWNTTLKKEELCWQIDQLKKMGFGGFHIHVRTGMDTEYLSEDFMSLIGGCLQKARENHMLAWLYDEDRWPSGAAGGLVTQQKEYRQRYLLLTRHPAECGNLIACYDVELEKSGDLKRYSRICEMDPASAIKLYVYEETARTSPWFNNQTYINTLDPKAVKEFIRITHERYKKHFSTYFGSLIPAIFTDEPQFSRKGVLDYAHDDKDVTLPWTDDFPESYCSAFGGEDILQGLPELLWDLPNGQVSRIRYHYHDHLAERFASAFADQCGSWCRKNGLLLTGHLMEEPTLESQTHALGEAMRSYRSFQLPGIDMLCDRREFTTAKQAQSAARQYGRPGVLSELYGVTNWDFDFRGHKLQGDWQAALGVTVRVPHLSWVSMNGESKRDYPATFGYQSPWFDQYPYIEDHFARAATILTRGRPVCHVGVIHPIESYWLRWGARENTAAVREQKDMDFQNLCQWLLRGCVDFDYLCESTLPEQCSLSDITNEGFPVGKMHYQTIIVPPLDTIRLSTLERLEKFHEIGGRVIFLGSAPRFVDAKECDRPSELWSKSERLPNERLALLGALSSERELEIRDSSGTPTSGFLYQMREEPGLRWLFIAHADAPVNQDIPNGAQLRFRIRGEWELTLFDTLSGTISPLESSCEDGWTSFSRLMYEHDSLMIRMAPISFPKTKMMEKK